MRNTCIDETKTASLICVRNNIERQLTEIVSGFEHFNEIELQHKIKSLFREEFFKNLLLDSIRNNSN